MDADEYIQVASAMESINGEFWSTVPDVTSEIIITRSSLLNKHDRITLMHIFILIVQSVARPRLLILLLS